ncbi:hybrid sensor histidine kinase/response regulator [Balneolales bacterium ANBcel1]|nr:hybrid sensor histidine kinase/response regulator [Balneolales bacterium ANBcel1]
MQKSLILIVDDYSKNLQLMETILQRKGYDTVLASNGREAIDILRNTKPDLVLLDIMMPEMDGYETCRVIKSDERVASIPVIFLTGKNDTEDVVKGLKIGASDYITKPFNTTELLLRVDTQVRLKKSQDELIEKNQELQQLNTSKDKFFSIISHDLKSPFQGLIGLTELLYEDIEQMGKEDIHEFAKMINESSRNLLNLLENLLEWSVLERNKEVFEAETTDLNPVLERNVRLFEASCSKKKITLKNNASGPVTAWCDKNMVDTVIRNLVSNAIKYTPEGGTITLESEADKETATVRVRDSGIGMDEQTRNNLFRIDEMKSRPGTNQEKGTGLGLLICKELMEKNDGEISVESAPGKGSVFTIRLPVSENKQHQLAASEESNDKI